MDEVTSTSKDRPRRETIEAALNLAGIGMLVLGDKKEILSANSSARAILGLAEDAMGRDFGDLFPQGLTWLDDDRDQDAGKPGLRIPGRPHKVVARLARSCVEDGTLLLFFQEITEDQATEYRPGRSKQLSKIDNLMSRFSHELRNPLASILAGLQALEKSGSLATEDSFILDLVMEEARAAARIIEQFRDSVRIRASSTGSVIVSELLHHCLADILPMARKKQLSVDLIADPPSVKIVGDESALRRALLHLLKNSVEACEKGARIVSGWRIVDPGEAQRRFPGFEGEIVSIFGQDAGCGIPADLPIAALFEPFVSTKPSAAGLGLPVAQQILKNHGGVISLHSRPSGGTEFEVFLPSGPRRHCWELKEGAQTDRGRDHFDCSACDIRQGRTSEFCWSGSARGINCNEVPEREACARCAYLRKVSLVPFYEILHRL